MRLIGRIWIYLCVVFLLTSCTVFQSVEVGEVQEIIFTRLGSQKISFEVLIPIENKNRLNFRITDVDLDVIVNNEYLGKIKNIEEILIFRQSSEVYTFPLDVNYSGANILKGAFTLFTLFLERKVDVKISGYIFVKSFWFTRKIQVEEQNIVIIKPKG